MNPLDPRPMTPEHVRDLVERTRAAMERLAPVARVTTHHLLARTMRDRGWHMTSLVRCAARYSALTRCTLTESGAAFDVNCGAVMHAWRRIYPGIPTRVDLRPT